MLFNFLSIEIPTKSLHSLLYTTRPRRGEVSSGDTVHKNYTKIMNGSRYKLSDTLPFMLMATNRTWKKNRQRDRAAGSWYFRLIDLSMMADCYSVRSAASVNESVSQSNNSPASGPEGDYRSLCFPQQTIQSEIQVGSHRSVCLAISGRYFHPQSLLPVTHSFAIFQFPIKHAQNMWKFQQLPIQ